MTLPPGLMLITDRRVTGDALVPTCRAALEAGFTSVMLREKDLPAGPLLALARVLAERCAAAGAPLLVNDRLDVALALETAGAHVGMAGLPVARARALLGPDRLLGYSAHEVAEAERALGEGADYVTLSPVFPSPSKPDLVPRGIALLEEAARRLPPGRWIALGGIEGDAPARVRRVGAAGAAVMGAVMRAALPAPAARALVESWRIAAPGSPA